MANVTENRVNTVIDDVTMDALKRGTQSLLDNMPFLVALTDEERLSLSGLDISNKVFVEEAFDYLSSNPGIMPPAVNAANLKNDLELYNQLDTVESWLQNVLNQVSDTKRLAAHEAYSSSLMIYKLLSVFSQTGVPGAQQGYERLSRRFAQSGRSTPTDKLVPNTEA